MKRSWCLKTSAVLSLLLSSWGVARPFDRLECSHSVLGGGGGSRHSFRLVAVSSGSDDYDFLYEQSTWNKHGPTNHFKKEGKVHVTESAQNSSLVVRGAPIETELTRNFGTEEEPAGRAVTLKVYSGAEEIYKNYSSFSLRYCKLDGAPVPETEYSYLYSIPTFPHKGFSRLDCEHSGTEFSIWCKGECRAGSNMHSMFRLTDLIVESEGVIQSQNPFFPLALYARKTDWVSLLQIHPRLTLKLDPSGKQRLERTLNLYSSDFSDQIQFPGECKLQ